MGDFCWLGLLNDPYRQRRSRGGRSYLFDIYMRKFGQSPEGGAFGAFGNGYNLAGGADGTQTGLNNSAVCDNRQRNLP